MVIHCGKKITLTALAKQYGLAKHCVIERYNKGLRGDELVAPVKIITAMFEGELQPLTYIAENSGISEHTIRQRYTDGLRGLALISTANRNKGLVRKAKKLNAETALEIFKLATSEKISHQAIADRYNISVTSVSSIKVGKSWFNVTGKIYKRKNTSNL